MGKKQCVDVGLFNLEPRKKKKEEYNMNVLA